MEAVWLKSHGLPHRQIAKLTGVSENALRAYFRWYATGGLDQFKVVQCHRPESALQAHATSLEAHFQAHPPATIKAAQQEIAALTGIRRSASQVRGFLKKNFSCAVAGWG
jgi:transposase